MIRVSAVLQLHCCHCVLSHTLLTPSAKICSSEGNQREEEKTRKNNNRQHNNTYIYRLPDTENYKTGETIYFKFHKSLGPVSEAIIIITIIISKYVMTAPILRNDFRQWLNIKSKEYWAKN